MPQITWQNIKYSNPAEAASPLASAANMINTAFTPLQNSLKQAETTDQTNWQTMKANNTVDARQALMKYVDPASLAAAQADGSVDNVVNAHGAQMDKAALLDFLDKRGTELQQRAVQTMDYQNKKLDFDQQGLKDQIGTYFSSSNPEDRAKGQALLNAHNELRNRTALQEQGTLAGHRDIVWDQENKKFALDQRKGENDIITSMMNARANQTSAGAAATNAYTGQLNAALGQRQFSEQMRDKFLERDQKLRGEASNYMAYNNPSSTDGLKLIGDEIKAQAPDPETAILWRQAASEASQQKGATVGTVMQTLLQMDKNRWYKSQGIQINNASEVSKELAGSDNNKAMVEANSLSLGRVRQQLADHATALTKNEENNWGLPAIRGMTGGVPTPTSGKGKFANPFDAQIAAAVAKAAPSQANGPTYTYDDNNPGNGELVYPKGTPPLPASKADTDAAAAKLSKAAEAALATQVQQENVEMARGDRTTYSPKVAAYFKDNVARSQQAAALSAIMNAKSQAESNAMLLKLGQARLKEGLTSGD